MQQHLAAFSPEGLRTPMSQGQARVGPDLQGLEERRLQSTARDQAWRSQLLVGQKASLCGWMLGKGPSELSARVAHSVFRVSHNARAPSPAGMPVASPAAEQMPCV